ncbi:MAG: hypothetical protein DHS80DRAFT_27313 [Piptocephalis tieghemiana]|nr:MAG: hypothetical protein DHS80DRAFT_27313 [Piptocephalis tieghemiana]
MVLEATMILMDNTPWMRNGDYTPSRVEAQGDAVNMLFSHKINDNPESAVGLLTTTSPSGFPEVLVTLTRDTGKILSGLHKTHLVSSTSASPQQAQTQASPLTTKGFMGGLQVAWLSLKHRQNRNLRQRVIAFVGSPIEEEERALVQLGKRLKKNSVSVDIISFGEHEINEAKLQAFLNAVNNNDSSHLVIIPPGPHLLSDKIRSSAIVRGEEAEEGGMGGGGEEFEFGVDPSVDPELALALRMSMEEERARQEAASSKKEGGGEGAKVAGEGEGETSSLLTNAASSSSSSSSSFTTKDQGPHMGEEALTEDEQIARAIAMSMGEDEPSAAGSSSTSDQKNDDMMDILGGLPGVDSAQLEKTLKGEGKEGDSENKGKGRKEDGGDKE